MSVYSLDLRTGTLNKDLQFGWKKSFLLVTKLEYSFLLLSFSDSCSE